MAEYQVDKEQLLIAIRRDCQVFLSFYMGDQLDLEIPDFHEELWDEFLHLLDEVNDPAKLTGTLKKLLGVPREHAKTTLVKLAVILFFRYSRLSFCAYISNTFAAALNAIKDIKDWMTSNQEVDLYGAPDIIKSSDTDGLFIMAIGIPGQERKKVVILKAFGVGTQIRGTLIRNQRPDFMVFDDVESQETAASKLQQAKLDAWCLGTALKSMGRLGLCVFIGNMIGEGSLLARLSRDAASEWRPTVFGAIIRDRNGFLRPLWKGRWTLQALLDEYASYRRLGNGHIWEAEMMNLTAKDIFGESLANAIRVPRPDPNEIEAGFICLDPAFGTHGWNDESAITVHLRLLGGDIPFVAELIHGRYKEEQLFDEMVAASYRWGLTTWVIEAQAAQRLLIPLFRAFLIQRGMMPELFLMIPILAGKESKASRILAFRTIVAKGSYGLCETVQELFERLEAYSPDGNDHDDAEDSASYGTLVWNLHGTLVKGQGRQDVAGLIMGTATAGSLDSIQMGVP